MYRLSDNVEIYADSDYSNAICLKRGVGVQYSFELDQNGKKFLKRLRTDSQLPQGLSSADQEILHTLENLGIVTQEPETLYSHSQRSQWQAFADWGLNPDLAQQKLSKERIAIIGTGGTGGWIAIQLASMGLTHFTLIDSDHVEASNLNRQVFTRDDVGKKKVVALREKILERNPNSKITTFEGLAQFDSPFDVWFSEVDTVLVTADFPSRGEAASIIGRACMKRKLRHMICGGYSGHMSSLGITVIPGVTPCWDCYLSYLTRQYHPLIQPQYRVAQGNRNTSGIAPSVMLAASITVMEFLNLILRNEPKFVGTHVDFVYDFEMKKTKFDRDPNCLNCNSVKQE